MRVQDVGGGFKLRERVRVWERMKALTGGAGSGRVLGTRSLVRPKGLECRGGPRAVYEGLGRS